MSQIEQFKQQLESMKKAAIEAINSVSVDDNGSIKDGAGFILFPISAGKVGEPTAVGITDPDILDLKFKSLLRSLRDQIMVIKINNAAKNETEKEMLLREYQSK